MEGQEVITVQDWINLIKFNIERNDQSHHQQIYLFVTYSTFLILSILALVQSILTGQWINNILCIIGVIIALILLIGLFQTNVKIGKEVDDFTILLNRIHIEEMTNIEEIRKQYLVLYKRHAE